MGGPAANRPTTGLDRGSLKSWLARLGLVGIPNTMRAPLFALLVLGCGSSVETPVTNDAAVADTRTDALSDAADATCEIGTIPTTAPYAYEVLFVGGDAGATIPTPTGGDPSGEWRYAKMTIYLSDSARSVIDLSKSSVDGKGYSSYTATNFRNATDQKITLETTIVGTVKRGTITKGKGTYKAEGNELVFAPECSESTAEGRIERIGWSRVDADHARLQFKPPPTAAGDFLQQIVIDLEKIK